MLDGFHVAMRLNVLGQVTKGVGPDPAWREKRLVDLDRCKHLLWPGHACEAVDQASWIEDDVEAETDDALGVACTKPKKLAAALAEFAVYIRRNAARVIDYGERNRAGERISSDFVESAINQIVAKRFSKRQSMRWTRRSAHLALQTRTRVLNGDLDASFRRRWPGFQPLPPATIAPGL